LEWVVQEEAELVGLDLEGLDELDLAVELDLDELPLGELDLTE
jgi:hypothetical protein